MLFCLLWNQINTHTYIFDWLFIAAATKMRRSNSWSEFEDYKYVKEVRDPEEIEKEQHQMHSK